MDFKVPERDGIGKLSSIIQLLLFLALFLLIYLPLRRVVHFLLLRILILIGDYVIVSLVTYLLIRPAMTKLEERLRNK